MSNDDWAIMIVKSNAGSFLAHKIARELEARDERLAAAVQERDELRASLAASELVAFRAKERAWVFEQDKQVMQLKIKQIEPELAKLRAENELLKEKAWKYDELCK